MCRRRNRLLYYSEMDLITGVLRLRWFIVLILSFLEMNSYCCKYYHKLISVGLSRVW